MKEPIKDMAIYGAGGLGKEIVALVDAINAIEPRFHFIGYFDDGVPKGKNINGHPILGGLQDLQEYPNINVVLGIGNPDIKAKICSEIEKQGWPLEFPVLIHPRADIPVSKDLYSFGPGTIITSGCYVSVHTEIGRHVLINVQSTIGHDVSIGDFTSVMPAANISGEVKLGSHCYIGVNATIINQISIDNHVKIGAGSVVLKSVDTAHVTLMGNPARIILKN